MNSSKMRWNSLLLCGNLSLKYVTKLLSDDREGIAGWRLGGRKAREAVGGEQRRTAGGNAALGDGVVLRLRCQRTGEGQSLVTDHVDVNPVTAIGHRTVPTPLGLRSIVLRDVVR